MITVVYVLPNSMVHGGIESFLLSYFSHFDPSKVKCVFCQLSDTKGLFDERIISNGGYVEYIPSRNNKIKDYMRFFQGIISKYKPTIFHINGDADCCKVIMALRKLKVKKIIAHSHNTGTLSKRFVFLKRLYTRRFTKYHFACSEAAGEWLFGKKDKFVVIKNAIEIDKFKFQKTYLMDVRNEFNIPENAFVVGNVAHLIQNHKNQLFLIDVFERIYEKNNNSYLLIVGSGKDEELIKSKAKMSTASQNIIFAGSRDDVFKFYSAFNIFCLPSFFEGQPIVLVEATASGLYSIISNCVPCVEELKESCIELSIAQNNEEQWANTMIEYGKKRNIVNVELISKSKFNIIVAANELMHLYEVITNE